MTEHHILESMTELALEAAYRIETACKVAVSAGGHFRLALSGGRTPTRLLQLLATPEWTERIDWQETEVFWTDERCVSLDHPESNAGTACRLLFRVLPAPPLAIHRIEGERPPIDAADRYEMVVRECLADDRIDLCLLGTGADGHVASLFPRHQALSEETRWVLPVHASAEPPWRVTMTLPLLNRSRETLFLIGGSEKAEALRRLSDGEKLPAAQIRADLIAWFIDRNAAQGFRSGENAA